MVSFIPEPFKFRMEEAIHVESQTLVGFDNCFSISTKEGNYYNVVNFYIESLEKLIKSGKVNWPIRVAVIGEKTCVINDHRIEEEHYLKRFCEVCCPMDLLPIHQRLEKSRRIMDGTTSFSCHAASETPWGKMPATVIESTTIKARSGKLSADWTAEIVPKPPIYNVRIEEELK